MINMGVGKHNLSLYYLFITHERYDSFNFATGINSQFLEHVVVRWRGGAPLHAPLRTALTAVGLAVFAANALMVRRVVRSRVSEPVLWSFALICVSIPFAVPT